MISIVFTFINMPVLVGNTIDISLSPIAEHSVNYKKKSNILKSIWNE